MLEYNKMKNLPYTSHLLRHLFYPERATKYIWLCGMLESGDYMFPHKVTSIGFELKP